MCDGLSDLRQIFFTIRTEIESRFNLKPARRLQGLHNKPRKDYSTSATAEDSPDYPESEGGHVSSESKYENFKFQIISGFAFLRFFSPALLSPHLYNLSNGRLDDNVGDILKVVARALQQLANLTPVGQIRSWVRIRLIDVLLATVRRVTPQKCYSKDSRENILAIWSIIYKAYPLFSLQHPQPRLHFLPTKPSSEKLRGYRRQ